MGDQRQGKGDRELRAIGTILAALEELDGESIQRVFDYVSNRLSINFGRALSIPAKTSVASGPLGEPSHLAQRTISVRDLREQKRPESSNQMAAIVAYYLSEVAESTERKESINASDLERYFKQAG